MTGNGFGRKGAAANLRVARARAGMSQRELSKRSGVCEATISFIESGKQGELRASTLSKLAAALGIEVEQLIG